MTIWEILLAFICISTGVYLGITLIRCYLIAEFWAPAALARIYTIKAYVYADMTEGIITPDEFNIVFTELELENVFENMYNVALTPWLWGEKCIYKKGKYQRVMELFSNL